MASQDHVQSQGSDLERDGEGKSTRRWNSSGTRRITRSSLHSESSESVEEHSEGSSLLPRYGHGDAPDYKSTEGDSNDEEEDRYRDEDNEDEEGGILGEQSYLSGRSVFAILALLMIGVFMSNADGSLVMATYGTISSEFGALAAASWLTTSYSLATCAVQPITGKLSDIYGRKGVLLASYALFAVGSVGCGIGQAMWQVIAGRVVAGLGAAGMTVIVSILITDLVPLIQVASWRSYVNVVATIGRSIGGPLGGYLADTVGWRWSFIGQGPIIGLAIILVALRLPSHTSPPISPPQHQNSKPPSKSQPSKLHRVDFIGALLLALAIVSLLGALSLGGQDLPWSHPVVIGLGAGSIVLGGAFVAWEVYGAIEPVFPPSLIVKRDVATAYGIITLQAAAQLAMMYTIPLFFRTTLSSSNTTAGSHLFPAVLGNTLGGLLSGLYISRTGQYKPLSLVAALSSSLSYFLLIIRWTANRDINWLESLEIVPGGFGTGIAFSATFIGLGASVGRGEMAMATSGLYLCSGLGMVLGVAGASAVQIGSLKTLLIEALNGIPGSGKIMEEVISSVSSIATLPLPIKKLVIESYVKSIEYAHMLSLACSIAAFVLACSIREHRLR
ncbi:major facilitator superfamily domain-containing protein [Rhexocercosporidium sp. MPI-PUGE-AT-0058]|nr:major facilitator superfamily domain-containing protein [Rhexocercosporidium sp. MPI-PUGE-AT-0058]